MKLYHRYVLRKVALVMAMSAVICSAALAVLSLVRLGQDRNLAIPPLLVLKLLLHYNVFLSIYAIPISMLIACLLVFGRFTADNEMIALRASGVPPATVFTSTLALGVILSFAMLWLNGWVAPLSHKALADTRFNAFSLDAFFAPGQTRNVKNYSITVNANKNGNLEGITINEESPKGQATSIRAEWGRYIDRRNEGRVQLELWNVQFTILERPPGGGETSGDASGGPADTADAETGDGAGDGGEGNAVVLEEAETYQITFDFEDIKARGTGAPDKDDLTLRGLLARRAAARRIGRLAWAGKYGFEFNKRLVFSLTPLVFALVGVPLGVRVHRGERSLGSGIAVLIALAYFLIIIGIEKGITEHGAIPSILVWVPCVAFMALGVGLIVRVNRGR